MFQGCGLSGTDAGVHGAASRHPLRRRRRQGDQDIRPAAAAASARLAAHRDIRAAAARGGAAHIKSIAARRSMFSPAISSSISKSARAPSRRRRATSRPMRHANCGPATCSVATAPTASCASASGLRMRTWHSTNGGWSSTCCCTSRSSCRPSASSIAGRSGPRPTSSARGTCAAGRSKCSPARTRVEFGNRDNVVKQLARFVDPAAIEVWRSAVYRFHALLAERWRCGRVIAARRCRASDAAVPRPGHVRGNP